jgi:hypothetical protein
LSRYSAWATAIALLAGALPAGAAEIFLNGTRIATLKNVELQHCTVKFDANGDLQITAPGYRVEYTADGEAKVVGQPDRAAVARPKQRYALVYEPSPKVRFTFEVWLNNKLLRKIGADSPRFLIDLGQELVAGANTVRVIARPLDGAAAGAEGDIAALRMYRGEVTADGTFRAKQPPLLEVVRSAIDQQGIDRSFPISAE